MAEKQGMWFANWRDSGADPQKMYEALRFVHAAAFLTEGLPYGLDPGEIRKHIERAVRPSKKARK